jgi:lipoprotein-releasing system ATP-binding protein
MSSGLELRNVAKSYQMAGKPLKVLSDANILVKPGEIVALLGPSGSGKSTLLHVAGLLDSANAGSVHIAGQDCTGLADRERTRIRRQDIGFVYQFHNLLPEFTALDNVAMPGLINQAKRDVSRAKASELLAKLGLAERINHMPAQLSGGEQQRVAIARALANEPKVLLADEPTGNLDEKTADRVFNELLKLAREQGVAALIATHNETLASRMDRRIVLHNGQLTEG